jgi:superfamily II DNA or RNA helicase
MSAHLTGEHLSPPNIEFAASLQAVLRDCESRDFRLDIPQQEAIESIGHALLRGKSTGYIEMATSTGKTAIEALVTEAAVRAGKRVLLLAPKVAIANQIDGLHREKPTGLARFTNLHAQTPIGRHYGQSRAKHSDQVVISTYSGFLNEAKNLHGRLGQFDVIIGDECHRSLGQHTSRAMKSSFSGAVKLGFSATPDFAVDRMSDEVFSEKLFEFSLIDAIEAGKTAPLRTLIYETEETLNLIDARSEFTERELAPFINNMQRNGTAHQLALDLVRDHRQGIIACIPGSNNVHARLMADMLSRSGVAAADIGAHLSPEEQSTRLKQFHNGDIDVLTFTRALEEGWDSDEASFCINMAPTASPVRTKQLIGRVMRKNHDDRESVYIDFVDQSKGVYKEQYTALHALELETIDFDRVLGGHTSGSTWELPSPLKRPVLSKALYERLLQSNGRLVNDVISAEKRNHIDPLVRHWEKVLEKERLPSEVTDNPVLTPALEKQLRKAHDLFMKHNGVEPTVDELVELLPNVPAFQKRVLGEYGIRVAGDEAPLALYNENETQDPHEAVTGYLLRKQILKILDTLTEREAGVITRRFGLKDGEEWDLDKIGRDYGVTRERIRQIESKTMSKLRHRSRSQDLQDYQEDPVDRRHETKHDKQTAEAPRTREKQLTDTFWDPDTATYQTLHEIKFYRTDPETGASVVNMESLKMTSGLLDIPLKRASISVIQRSITERISEIHNWREGALAAIKRFEELPVRLETMEQRAATLTIYDSKVRMIDSLIGRLESLRTFWAARAEPPAQN